MSIAQQLAMFEELNPHSSAPDTTSTFIDNMKLPIHRWFRYSAGFSAEWVKSVIQKTQLQPETLLLDPFAGSGTTLLAAQQCGIASVGLEAHPFVARIARAKVGWNIDTAQFTTFAQELYTKALTLDSAELRYPKLIQECFPPAVLKELDALRRAWLTMADNSTSAELCWLAITAILRACSPVGTSQMELIQPKKLKKKPQQPFDAFQLQLRLMLQDITHAQQHSTYTSTHIYQGDARELQYIEDDSVGIVISSPPYANNFDYADATRLEMSFWGEISGWGDLQATVRQHLIRSCAQHMSPRRDTLEAILADEILRPINHELAAVCEALDQERQHHGGKKNYHLMIAAYFSDLARVWKALRRVCQKDSTICFVIGDSAPYGIYVPVHTWLGDLAIASGFQTYHFEKTRDRNMKWKNRKHRVPLCEGRLWVYG